MRAPVDPREREVREERRLYLDERTRELESQGFEPDEARRRALEAFGNPDEVVVRVMEQRRPGEAAWTSGGVLVRIGSAVHRVARDVRHAARALRRSHQVSPLDRFAFGTPALLLLGTALAASWLPARRAARTDPLEALRSE